jgi:hypothetical protein
LTRREQIAIIANDTIDNNDKKDKPDIKKLIQKEAKKTGRFYDYENKNND